MRLKFCAITFYNKKTTRKMAKTILIPTDFEVESLNTAKLLLTESHEQVNILLVYAEHLSDSIPDLVFYSQRKRIDSLMTHEFNEALAILRNRFSDKLGSLKLMLFHGRNRNAFENFVEANHIHEVHIPKTYTLKRTKDSIDIAPFVAQSNVEVHEHEWSSYGAGSTANQLHLLFNT